MLLASKLKLLLAATAALAAPLALAGALPE
jgi:hypothetical protein